MRTVEVQLPEPVLEKAREIASRENIPLEHLLSMAVTQSIGAWTKDMTLASESKAADRRRFLDMLQQALDAEQTGFQPFMR